MQEKEFLQERAGKLDICVQNLLEMDVCAQESREGYDLRLQKISELVGCRCPQG